MAAYAGTTTLIFSTVFGNKRVNLFQVDITNYNATGIPFTKAIAGLNQIDGVFVITEGGLANANAPLAGSYIAASNAVMLYKAVNSAVADDTNIHGTLGIHVYLVAIGN